jgi:hypothetical protein
MFEDEGRSLRLWESDQQSIELGLRLVQQKFGKTLELTGPDDLSASGRSDRDRGESIVKFTDEALNVLMRAHKGTLDEEKNVKPEQERAIGSALRRGARDGKKPSSDEPKPSTDSGQEGPEPDLGMEH